MINYKYLKIYVSKNRFEINKNNINQNNILDNFIFQYYYIFYNLLKFITIFYDKKY